MALNNASNFLLYNSASIPEFINPKFKNVATSLSAFTGTQDLYTVPSDKRVFVAQLFSNIGNIASRFTVKSGGTYYNLDISTAPGFTFNQISFGANRFPVVLGGETIAVNTTSSATGNIWLSFIEFDNNSQLNRGALFTLAAGNNTIYTCPTGYQALPCSFAQPIFNNINTNCTVNYLNQSGGTRTLSIYYVPNGSSPSSTNLTWSGTIANNNYLTTNLTALCFPALQAGDSFVLNTDAATTSQIAWINVLERKL